MSEASIRVVWAHPCAEGHQWVVMDRQMDAASRNEIFDLKCQVCNKEGHVSVSQYQLQRLTCYGVGSLLDWDGEPL